MPDNHRIQIDLFGALRKYGHAPLSLEIPTGSTVRAVKARVAEALTHLGPFEDHDILSVSALATERRVLGEDECIDTTERLALLPPVCGG
jgi:molybdopterin converting factor small subunit